MSIEVELKFTATAQTRGQLEALGAKRTHSQQFTDVYCDTSTHLLMLQDHWLRKRDQRWELKRPVLEQKGDLAGAGEGSAERKGHVDRYYELDREEDILGFLSTVIPETKSVTSLDDLVRSGVLIHMAEFLTTRETYAYSDGEGPVVIDLDDTDFGYAVGEVEVMVKGGEGGMAAAEARVKAMAAQIGESKEEPPGGKLSSFLSRHHPALWQQLMERGLLRRP